VFEVDPKIQFRNSNLQEFSENVINTISTFHNRADCFLPKKVGRFLFVIETAERNLFLIVLMALFLNSQGRAEFPVQILCFLMNRRAFQTFDVGCAGEKGFQDLSSGFQLTGHTVKKSQGRILKILCLGKVDLKG
jgi:hypothetical protein